MATVTTLVNAVATRVNKPSYASNVRLPFLVQYELNYAAALVAKGSALAAADIFELIRIPAGCVVITAGAQIKVAGNSTTLTLGIGTGVDDNEWVDALDGKAVAGTYGTDLSASPVINTYPTTDTIDVTFQTLTGTLSTGIVRVYALLMDVSDDGVPGIVQLGS